MGRYEVTIKVAQIQRLVEERKYKKAAAVLATLDVRQIRSRADLHTFAEVYMKTEQFDAAKAIYLRLYKRNRTRRIIYRLIYLAIRTNELEEAESFYQEFLELSNSTRDNLILRYRIDKAKGVPIGQLIDTLEKLKEEEYIEEWAYELAKLYQRAGRDEDCRQECQDIKLWFGEGEIVERADMLLEYLDGDGQLYYEDKDYTVKEKEAPNPDDTGSLPDLTPEVIKKEKERLKQKKREEKEQAKKEAEEEDEEEFVDDYEEETEQEEGDMLLEPGELAQMAKDGLMKLSGFWKRGSRNAEGDSSKEKTDADQTNHAPNQTEGEAEEKTVQKSENVAQKELIATKEVISKPSQSGMGITQDLAKEIAAIFEAEQRGQLKEKAAALTSELVEKAGEVPNIASNVVDRMSQAVQSKSGKQYIPLDITDPEEDAEELDVDRRAYQPDGMEEIVAARPEQQPGEKNKAAEQGTSYGEVHAGEGSDVTGKEAADAISTENIQKEEEEVTMIELDKIMPEPDMPELKQVIPEDSPELGNQPALEEKELPTTKALHHSFDDILTLIAGELEPKHFVLMGEGEERILGITKKIVRVMNKKGFLSTNQIARIHSEQLNEMDLLKVCHQIKGSCLLIDGAAKLLFPTITKIFAVMDAFRGDFVVVLADEGNTLDEMFRVAPALARRFEYVIDISQYGEEDYR